MIAGFFVKTVYKQLKTANNFCKNTVDVCLLHNGVLNTYLICDGKIMLEALPFFSILERILDIRYY